MPPLHFPALILSLLLAACMPAWAAAQEETLRIGVKTGSPPYTYWDETGDMPAVRGLSIDMGRLLGKAMGRRVEFIQSEDLAARRAQLNCGRIDLIMFDSPGLVGNAGYIFIPTDIFLNRRLFVHTSCRDVVCLKDLGNKRVVTVSGDDYWHPREQPEPYSVTVVATPLEALKRLERGVEDVYVAPSEEVAEAFIKKYGFGNIRKVGIVLEQIPLFITLRQDDHQLATKLTAAMARISASGALKQLKEKWFGVDFMPATWERYRQELFIAVALVLSVLLGIVVWNTQIKAKVRQVTRSLQSSEQNFRNVIDSSPDMILVIDRHGGIRRSNPSAAKLLGEHGDGEGTTFAAALPDIERKRCLTFLAEVFAKGQATAEFHLHGPGGTLRDIDVAATRVQDHESGEPLACCFARDMTERNRMEQELVQSDRLATIGKMAATVAHEINNPLGIIRANVEMLLARDLPPGEAREFLDSIRRNSIRAGNITRDLLATARPKAPQMAELDLHELTKATLSMIAPQLKGTEIVHQNPQRPMLVWGDSSLLQQVLINVLLNAKAALKGRPAPRLEIRYCHPAGGSIRLLILDNGKGIARGHLNEIFEPFFSSGKPEGFGLGLFISRRIVEHHGGVMYAESEPEKGMKMIIELPIEQEQDSGENLPKAEPATQRAAP